MSIVLLMSGYAIMAAAIVVLIVIIRKQRCRDVGNEDVPLEVIPKVLSDDVVSMREYEMEDLKDRLCELMERERLYLNPNIRVSDVAERLYTNKSYLSQAIRTKLNKNFCQLVHSYRVKEAVRLYSQNQDLSIVDLCKKVGFNSMATFTSAFSRNTGYTPADWCRQYKRQSAGTDTARATSRKGQKDV